MKPKHPGQAPSGGSGGVCAESRREKPEISASAPPRKNLLMHVLGDYHGVMEKDQVSKKNLEHNLRMGAKHLMASEPDKRTPEGAWDVDELKRMKENCDKYGMILEGLRMNSGYILLKPGPERDRRIEVIQENIAKMAQIGVKRLSFQWQMIPLRRNATTTGRGRSSRFAFTLEDDWKALPLTAAGRVTSEDYWERITFFNERIIPVAAENGVYVGVHPYDPSGLPFGYQGVDNWDAPPIFDNLKRYVSTPESPYNGLQLCLGTIYEGLCITNTDKELLYEIVRYFGERKKLFSIHFRNIVGSPGHFETTYADEGEIDLFRIIKILRDVQYPGGIIADGNIPTHPDDPGSLLGNALGKGYIIALIHAANAEAV